MGPSDEISLYSSGFLMSTVTLQWEGSGFKVAAGFMFLFYLHQSGDCVSLSLTYLYVVMLWRICSQIRVHPSVSWQWLMPAHEPQGKANILSFCLNAKDTPFHFSVTSSLLLLFIPHMNNHTAHYISKYKPTWQHRGWIDHDNTLES